MRLSLILFCLIYCCLAEIDYLMVGYNYADVCCNVSAVTAVQVQYSVFDGPKVVSPPLFNNTPIAELMYSSTITTRPCTKPTTENCTETVVETRVKLTEHLGFVVGQWYIVCFISPASSDHCILYRPCDCDCSDNAWVQMNITVESIINIPPESNLFKWGYESRGEATHCPIKTPIMDFSTSKVAYDSCPDHGWTNLTSIQPVSNCHPNDSSGIGIGYLFPNGGMTSSTSVSENVTAIVVQADVAFDVNELPPPFTMTNYVQNIGVFTSPFTNYGMKRTFTHYIRIVSDQINVGQIDLVQVEEICRRLSVDDIHSTTVKPDNAGIGTRINSALLVISISIIFQ